ncbi:Butyrate--CoA ligase AAE11, peroxisomal [Vitis vinifera]|uniref:Butyrate--CoA ligase AAE11, peroxisomal n=1 Tax=Vitis vinifera TaxID=29760 RepID=A0A438FM32_VITVI|nr:Butyrate--CoA ligase AAE11, peroxisomal [Vitis vinifera]
MAGGVEPPSPRPSGQTEGASGISILTLADVDVKNPDTMASVPRDGKSMGEIVLRGSSIMKGYFKDPEATSKAFKNGWFFTGDVGVIHPDGYLEIKDRSKDVIISGGENISSVEVESILYRHPRVLEAAVVAMPHPKWGESPCAFITINKNQTGQNDDVSEDDIIQYCRKNLPRYMIPKKVELWSNFPRLQPARFKIRVEDSSQDPCNFRETSNKKSTPVNVEQPKYLAHQPHEQILALSRL